MKRDKTDTLFSKFIRLLEGGYCKKCKKYFGLTQGLHCAHYFSRGRKSTRWYRDNATALCTHCHFDLDRHPEEKQEFFRKILGKKRFEALCEREKELIKYTPDEIEAIEADLKRKIKLLED